MFDQQLLQHIKQFGDRIYLHGVKKNRKLAAKILTENNFTLVNTFNHYTLIDVILVLDNLNPYTRLSANVSSTVISLIEQCPYDAVYHEVFIYRDGCLHASQQYNSSLVCSNLDREFYKRWCLRSYPEFQEVSDTFSLIYAGPASNYSVYYLPFLTFKNQVHDEIQCGKKHFLFFNADENGQPSSLLKCQRVAEQFADHDVKFYYMTAGIGMEKVYNFIYFRNKFRNKIKILEYFTFQDSVSDYVHAANNDFEHRFADHMPNITAEFANEIKMAYRPRIKSKMFLSFNRVPRAHRCVLTAQMIRRGLIDKSYYSFDYDPGGLEYFQDREGVSWVADVLKNNEDLFPLKLNRTEARDNAVDMKMDDLLYYNDSYFSVVTETVYDYKDGGENYPAIFFSEKTYKPILCKHPFILVAAPGSLAVLRDAGFMTFRPYINEDYDTIDDHMERLDAISEEIERLCNLNHNEWMEIQDLLIPALEHNYRQLTNKDKLRLTTDLQEYIKR